MAIYNKTAKYWLQLKEDWFDEDAIKWIEEQKNGKEYSLFYMKLMLKSIKTNGYLIRKVGELLVPYVPETLGALTNTEIDTVIVAMELLTKTGLVKVLEDGAIFIECVQNMIGSSTVSAIKKQEQIARKNANKDIGWNKSGNNSTKDKDKDKDKDKTIIYIYIGVLDYLNEKAGTKFKPVESNLKFIRGRFANGYTEQDLKAVIDKQVAEWKGTDMQKYLRPETLFNATKFESYFNGLDNKPKSSHNYNQREYTKEELETLTDDLDEVLEYVKGDVEC